MPRLLLSILAAVAALSQAVAGQTFLNAWGDSVFDTRPLSDGSCVQISAGGYVTLSLQNDGSGATSRRSRPA